MQIKKMKAAILVESRKPLTVAEIELPRELACGQALVKIHYISICGSQINEAIQVVKSGAADRVLIAME